MIKIAFITANGRKEKLLLYFKNQSACMALLQCTITDKNKNKGINDITQQLVTASEQMF